MISRLLKSEKGQSAVEFALILPLLVTILCGVIDLGWLFSNRYQVENAAHAGVRYVLVQGADVAESEKNKLITETKTAVEDNLLFSPRDVRITVDIGEEDVSVEVKCKVKMLTFVGQQVFGDYYEAEAKNTGAR